MKFMLVLSFFALMAIAYCQEYVIQSPYFVQTGHDSRINDALYAGAGYGLGGYGGYGGYAGGYGGYGGYYK